MIRDEHTNRLIDSMSPYLLQHAHNPVDWHPWSEAAIERAREEDKPIFLSIGYSACHWCHVMERESFENEEIAKILNENFICIKVDREERPDLDEIYMNAVQLMTGSGGWPLSVFLTPQLKPFFGGTYFPPDDALGRPGFKRVLTSVAQIFRDKRDEIEKSGNRLCAALRDLGRTEPSDDASLNPKPIVEAVRKAYAEFDLPWGGFGPAPKFPQSALIRLLLRHHHRTRGKDALRMATLTLDRMACGGMYDQLGGGFHRYSVDRQWLVPHFEKMLYDNAQLAVAYLEAFQLTGKPLYRRVAQETLDFVLRDMTDKMGGFHSTLDADSEGKEGKYYVWSRREILQVLGDRDGPLFCRYYGVTDGGNFDGRNVLHITVPVDELATELGVDGDSLHRRLAEMNRRLLAARERRAPPGKDDKILASWNGLMISAFARGYQVLGVDAYRAAAERAAEFVLNRMICDGRLLHVHRKGRSRIDACLDDHAFLVEGLLDLFEATFDVQWITRADRLTRSMIGTFWDNEAAAFYSTPAGRPDIIVQTKSAYDGATPSGNSVAAHGLLRLAVLTGNPEYSAKGKQTLIAFKRQMEGSPMAFARMLCTLDFHLGPVREVVVCGPPQEVKTRELVSAFRARYLPNSIIASFDPGAARAAEMARVLPLLRSKPLVNDGPTVYVCRNHTCSAPVTSAGALADLLAKK